MENSVQLESKRGGTVSPDTAVSESMARGKDAIGAAADEAMNAARSDLQSLRSDLNSLRDTVTKFASQAGTEAAKSAREVSSNVAGQVGGTVSDLSSKGVEQAKTLASELENIARRNPLGAIAGAVVLGALIGLMGRRS